MADDPSVSPNDEGLDGIDRRRPAASAAPVDEGLVSWARMLQSHLAMQTGVEMIGSAGSSVNFRFRGQEFSVHVYRTA
jgi:hypothetical protein